MSACQPNLFNTAAAPTAPEQRQPESLNARRSYLEGRLRECRDPQEQEHLLAQLRELEPEGIWNGNIFVTSSDVAF